MAKVRVIEMVFWEFLTLSVSGEGENQRTLLLDPAPRLHSDPAGVRSRMLVLESSKHNFILAITVLAVRDESTRSVVSLLLRRRRYKESKLKYPRYHIGVSVKDVREVNTFVYLGVQISRVRERHLCVALGSRADAWG